MHAHHLRTSAKLHAFEHHGHVRDRIDKADAGRAVQKEGFPCHHLHGVAFGRVGGAHLRQMDDEGENGSRSEMEDQSLGACGGGRNMRRSVHHDGHEELKGLTRDHGRRGAGIKQDELSLQKRRAERKRLRRTGLCASYGEEERGDKESVEGRDHGG
ncbi:hypothetical protein FGB62_159g12 [Gracilaria domingensis]|nr:hypothetical protein FGB62_159g12 [Gracilaria domingensis]